jgi:hypothetical protein
MSFISCNHARISKDNNVKAKGKSETRKRGFQKKKKVPTFCLLPFAFCLLPFFLSACSPPRHPDAEERDAVKAIRAKLQACLPDAQPESGVRLAVVSFSREKEEATVRLLAYNPTDRTGVKPAAGATAVVDFDVPNYLMSRGRWLINESGRAYLLDERCREYKLKDRQITLRQAEAKNGRIQLQPGEACEVILSFARLPDDAQEIALVYGTQILRLCL